MNNQGPFDNNQFVVSYELLLLLRWLLDHEHESLKKLITKSLRNGLNNHLKETAPDLNDEATAAELQQNIIDFFVLIEALMLESVNEDMIKTTLQRTLIPAIDHIDSQLCDMDSVAMSIAKATSALHNNSGKNPKDVLCKELLKRWKPAKKLSH